MFPLFYRYLLCACKRSEITKAKTNLNSHILCTMILLSTKIKVEQILFALPTIPALQIDY